MSDGRSENPADFAHRSGSPFRFWALDPTRSNLAPTVLRGNAVFDTLRRHEAWPCRSAEDAGASWTAIARGPWERVERIPLISPIDHSGDGGGVTADLLGSKGRTGRAIRPNPGHWLGGDMRNGDPGPSDRPASAVDAELADRDRDRLGRGLDPDDRGSLIVTEVSPFHCLYQDALEFHSQSRLMLARSESGSSRLARAALLLYGRLGRVPGPSGGRRSWAGLSLPRCWPTPSRPLPLEDAWRLLPAIAGQGATASGDPSAPPWAAVRRAARAPDPPGRIPVRRSIAEPYYRAPRPDADFEPLQPHQIPAGAAVTAGDLLYPPNRTASRSLRPPAAPPRHRPRSARRGHRRPQPPARRRPDPRQPPPSRAHPARHLSQEPIKIHSPQIKHG